MVKIKMCNNGQKSSAFFSLFYILLQGAKRFFIFVQGQKECRVSLLW